ncbi:leucine-rich repeat-containing protein 58-like [Mya arenaria]|uniref:leucine-rich repeat-containing protein 58-like n=1 Tax=Mya arenaria TaxID=6604 RepID=UPI0022E66360|nr:leucine-rich repeat-containing protein 58-like [Mya arenaria]
MADTLTQFFTWAVRDVIFFSGDVQTTTIAVAITSSLCCSIVVAVVHFITLIRPQEDARARMKHKFQRQESKSSIISKRYYSQEWFSGERVHVPCVRCGNYYADEGCRFVTCRTCCFSTLACHVHQKSTTCSTPCDNRHTQIDLSCGGLHSCPSRLGFVGSQLTCLNLNGNHLQSIPAEIGCLRGLQVLSLEKNQLTELPETLGSLTELHCLDISHNTFKHIPSFISKLVRLEELHLSHNVIQLIPPEISRLKLLLILDISHNNLPFICDEVFSLFQLKWLNASANKLEMLPEKIGHLVNLETLDVSSCSLTCLPGALVNCSKLCSLLVNSNKLSFLPCRLGLVSSISRLEVIDNQLSYLPYTLSNLQGSILLKAQGNPLLVETSYRAMSRTISKGDNCFPRLLDLVGREIIKRHIPLDTALPLHLKDMLQNAGCCSICQSPVFEVHEAEIVPVTFNPYSFTVPLLKQVCSQHVV